MRKMRRPASFSTLCATFLLMVLGAIEGEQPPEQPTVGGNVSSGNSTGASNSSSALSNHTGPLGIHLSFLRRPAWHYQPATPPQLLDRVRSYAGDDSRMRAFAARLLLGLPTTIVWLGGSVSLHNPIVGPDETWVSMWHKWLESVFTSCGDAEDLNKRDAPHHGTNPTYLDNRHMCNASHVTLDNLAVWATTVEFLELCQWQSVPKDAHMVVFETAVNDIRSDAKEVMTPGRRALERMIRSALALPSKPAVLLFASYSWLWASRFNKQAELKRFPYQQEDMQMMLAQYYGDVQVLSTRALLYHTMMAQPNEHRLALFTDNVHLTGQGHVLYSDILIHYTRQYVRGLYMDVLACAHGSPHSSPPSAQGGGTSGGAAAGGEAGGGPHHKGHHHSSPELCSRLAAALAAAKGEALGATASKGAPYGALKNAYLLPEYVDKVVCYSSGDWRGGRAVVPLTDPEQPDPFAVAPPLDPELPPPLAHGNYARRSHQEQCAYGERLPTLLAHADSEWEFKDETGGNKRKFGYISHTPDSYLELNVPLDDPDAQAEAILQLGSLDAKAAAAAKEQLLRGKEKKAAVSVVYLKSNSNEMGTASVACTGACKCTSVLLEGYSKDQASLMEVQGLELRYTFKWVEPATGNATLPAAGGSTAQFVLLSTDSSGVRDEQGSRHVTTAASAWARQGLRRLLGAEASATSSNSSSDSSTSNGASKQQEPKQEDLGCRLRVTVLNKTETGGHKVKIIGLVVGLGRLDLAEANRGYTEKTGIPNAGS